MNGPRDRWILKILQQSADLSIFWAQILDFACKKNIFAHISDKGRNFNGGFS